MKRTSSFDEVWDGLYVSGHRQSAPWDHVVSFIFRNAPKGRPRADIRILEVGCGTAANLLFAAQQGFSVTGLDAAASAIESARTCFAEADLPARLDVGDFIALPYDTASFDLVIDRGAITCTNFESAKQCISEIARVIKPQGKFFFNPYSDRSTSAASGECLREREVGGLRHSIREGTLVGVGQICFYGLGDIFYVLPQSDWMLQQVQHMEWFDCLQPYREMHAEYRVVAIRR